MQEPPGARRDRIAMLFALATFACVASLFFISKGTQVLMPGPLASAHGAIENCSTCHTKSGSGKLSWLHGLIAGDRHADSKACLSCHKMPEQAFNAHGASIGVVLESTKRLKEAAKGPAPPPSARAQSHLFPAEAVASRLYCATCHQEHQGVSFDLNKISNEQCRSCHVVKFDSFDGQHPKFERFPFERRTRIIYDHAGHFGKHYPEVSKKEPAKRPPDTCSTCHNSRDDKQLMAVAPFDQTCSSCHLDQITGKQRATGPKGIAFLTVPGLDVQTLKSKNAAIGEWPEDSEAALSPFMKVMIGRTEQGQALLKAIDSLNLQDLASASDDQIKAVTELAWEVKGLLHALIKGKASDVLGDLDIGGGAKLSANLVADLTASFPRDAVIGAQQEWLPNLAAEMANRLATGGQKTTDWSPVVTDPGGNGSASPGGPANSSPPSDSPQATGRTAAAKAKIASSSTDDAATALPAKGASPATEPTLDEPGSPEKPSTQDAGGAAKAREAARKEALDPPVCIASLFGQCLVYKEQKDKGDTSTSNDGTQAPSAGALPGRMNAGAKYAQNAAQPKGADPEAGAEAHVGSEDRDPAVTARWPLPSGTPRSIEAQGKAAKEAAKPAASVQSRPGAASAKDAGTAPQPEAAVGQTDAAKADGNVGAKASAASVKPSGNAGDQTDELLFPTEEEQREINAHRKGGGTPDGTGPNSQTAAPANALAASEAATVASQARTESVVSIASDVDPESWAEYGGWYRQDHAIYYRPVGHKDKFIYSWLLLTGPQAPKGDASPAAAVFNYLTSKDAQGSCTKCHSVDDLEGKGRLVNFAPASKTSKQGRFTTFIHEPHFGIVDNRTEGQENRGCLACHSLAKSEPTASSRTTGTARPAPEGAATSTATTVLIAEADKAVSPYLKSYEQGSPHNFASGFGSVNKELCQSCHTATKARQDCVLCHKYHVNGVTTPIMSTKNPM